MNFTTVLAPAALALVTACGGSPTSHQASFAENITGYQALATQAGQATSFDGVLSGGATYDGYFTIAEFQPEATRFAALGEASVTVDFDSGVRTGSATNFYEIDPDMIDFESNNQDLSTVDASAIDGELNLSQDGTRIVGSLVHLDGETATYNLGVQNFEIVGASGEYLLVESEGTSAALGRDDLKTDGTFIGVDTTN